jgi:phenylacetate-CoA ligase
VRLGTSTGTTGQPTITVWTRKDLWIEYESGARNWWRSGYRPGMIITHAHPAYLYGGAIMLQSTYEYCGLLSLWVPPPDTDELAEQAVRFWQRVTPDIPFMGFATGRFIEVATKLGIPLEEAGLTGLKAPPGFGLGRGGMPLMTAGAECYAYAAGPCGESPGGHIHEDWAVIQAIDPATGKEVPDGEWGNLTCTTLDRDNGLLRYDLEEACAIMREPCPCGETSIRGLWGGRFKDLLECQGTRFQLNELQAILTGIKEFRDPSLEYQVVRPDGTDQALVIRVEVATSDPSVREGAASKCAAEIRETLGVTAAFELLERETIPRAGYKATRVIDPD